MASAMKWPADEKVPVLTVGAGPAGLTHALARARHGVRGIVLCRYPVQAHNPKAHITNRRTLEIFRDLGVYEAVAAVGNRLESMPYNPFVLSPRSRTVADTDRLVDVLNRPIPDDWSAVGPQPDLTLASSS